jgi:hypothetical protein
MRNSVRQVWQRLREANEGLLKYGIGLVVLGIAGTTITGLLKPDVSTWAIRVALVFLGLGVVALSLVVGVNIAEPEEPEESEQPEGLEEPEPPSRRRRVRLVTAIAVILAAVVVAVVRVVIIDVPPPPCELQLVRGVVGSEKQPFFDDPEVQRVFGKYCMQVEAHSFGSQEMAGIKDLKKNYAFAFPGSSPAADKIQEVHKLQTTVYEPFSSPMAIATFKNVAELLRTVGVTRHDPRSGVWTFNVRRYLQLAGHLRWKEIPGNTSDIPKNKTLLISTTHPRQSNSAAMYIAILSYVLNGDVIQDAQSKRHVIPRLTELFKKQGYLQRSTEGPFEDYLAYGISKGPMVLVYEAQFISRRILDLDRRDQPGPPAIRPEMMLMYPVPTAESKHTLVPLSEEGHKVGRLLKNDRELRERAAIFGFHTPDGSYLTVWGQYEISVPSTYEFAPLPDYNTLDEMLKEIADQYEGR